MKLDEIFTANYKEIDRLADLKLPLKKSIVDKILTYAYSRQTTYCSLVQMWRGKIIERTFAVRINRKKQPEYQEVVRKIEGNNTAIRKNMYFSQMAGYKTVWKDTYPSAWSFDKKRDTDVWYHCRVTDFGVYRHFITTMNELKEIDPTLKYCAWNEQQDIIYYVTLYRKYPEIEMLSKLGLYRLMYNSHVLNKMQKDKEFKKYLCRCNGGQNTTGKDVLAGYKVNLPIPEVVRIKILNEMVKSVPYDFIDKKKLFTYFEKYREKNGTHIHVQSYNDMIKAEEYLHLDMTLDKNLFPHDFQKWHDHYTKLYNVAKNAETDRNIKKQAVKYKKLEKQVEDLKLILATSSDELIVEGEKLHHCVGRMGYSKKMAEGKSLILFVRKEEDIETPYFTMEYDPTKKKILQLYGDHDIQPEKELKDKIYNNWLPKVSRLRFA